MSEKPFILSFFFFTFNFRCYPTKRAAQLFYFISLPFPTSAEQSQAKVGRGNLFVFCLFYSMKSEKLEKKQKINNIDHHQKFKTRQIFPVCIFLLNVI